MKRNTTLFLAQGAMIAALYVALTHLSNAVGLANGAVQFRLSEALCILSVFTPAAVPGLTVGCLIANLTTGCLWQDVLFGTLATLLGALGGRLLGRYPLLSPLPTVLANALIVPPVLIWVYGAQDAYPLLLGGVALGEAVCAWGAGMILYYALKPHAKRLFGA